MTRMLIVIALTLCGGCATTRVMVTRVNGQPMVTVEFEDRIDDCRIVR